MTRGARSAAAGWGQSNTKSQLACQPRFTGTGSEQHCSCSYIYVRDFTDAHGQRVAARKSKLSLQQRDPLLCGPAAVPFPLSVCLLLTRRRPSVTYPTLPYLHSPPWRTQAPSAASRGQPSAKLAPPSSVVRSIVSRVSTEMFASGADLKRPSGSMKCPAHAVLISSVDAPPFHCLAQCISSAL